MTNELRNTNLPKHLRESLENHYAKCARFGLNPDFATKARKQAEERGDDFNPIHGLVG